MKGANLTKKVPGNHHNFHICSMIKILCNLTPYFVGLLIIKAGRFGGDSFVWIRYTKEEYDISHEWQNKYSEHVYLNPAI